jgi:putative nucleotidyltransferase with HDIG domain
MSDFKSRFTDDLVRLDQLPSLPAVVTHLIEMIDDPLASAMDVAHTLREDPPLTARVLRMANSPVYGGRFRIMSVPQAVMRLGMLEIRNVVMSLGVIRSMLGAGRRLDYRTFWQHSLTVALATETLAEMAPRHQDGEDDGAFAAGLLHDIGRFILDQFYPDDYDAALAVMDTERIPLREAEWRALGTDHAEVGGLLGERWGLPEPIVAGIAGHHNPEAVLPSLRRNPLLIRVAEQTCVAHGLGDPLEGEPVVEPSDDWQALGLDQSRVKQVVNATILGARKSALLLALA